MAFLCVHLGRTFLRSCSLIGSL